MANELVEIREVLIDRSMAGLQGAKIEVYFYD